MNTQSKLKNRILGMSLMLTLIGTSGLVLSDDDEHEESEYRHKGQHRTEGIEPTSPVTEELRFFHT